MNLIDEKHEYLKLLEKLENFEIKTEDSNEKVDDLDQLRFTICGCTSNDSKTELTAKLYQDLNAEEVSNLLIEKICKLIAELAKNDNCRKALVEQNMFEPINKCLKKPDLFDSSRIQIYRAIGNMCYYNDLARLAYLKSGGLNQLLDSCKYCTIFDYSSMSNEEKQIKNTLITVVLGCLHNTTNENETLRKAVYDMNIMSVLKQFIPFLKYSVNILIHFSSCLENLMDLDAGKEEFKKEKLALVLYESIDSDFLQNLSEYTEDFFNFLSIINEIEMSKQYLFQTDFLVKVIDTLEKSSNNLDLSRHLSLFLVSLLIKDEKIDEIFEYKDNLILNKAINWLIDFKSEQFYIASAVIIANYLRSDENVKKLMQDSRLPHVKIIEILKLYHAICNPSLPQINITHSLLGSLRNFCVAASMRTELLKCNLIETVLPFCDNDNLEVKSKSLSIIRLMVKSCTQTTGLDLIFDPKSLEMLAKIANNPGDNPIVVGESSRLSCYLPIAAKSELNIEKFCKHNFIPVICNQLKSEHLIMLNEALLALNVLVTINYRASREQLKQSNLNECLKNFFGNEKVPLEMSLNAFKLFKFLLDTNDFYKDEELKEFLIVFNKMKVSAENDFLKKHLNQLIELIEEGLI